jgi:ABC-type polysaccharide transport system permease subunit
METLMLALPINNLLQTEYQEIFSTLLLLTPELSLVINQYVLTYYLNSSINFLPTAIFDSYTNNMNYYYSEGILYFMLFSLYI